MDGQGDWLGLGLLKQRGVVCSQVHSFLVHVHAPGQQLELLLYVHHVLLDGVEGSFRAHFVGPPHVDSAKGQTETWSSTSSLVFPFHKIGDMEGLRQRSTKLILKVLVY